MNDFFASISTVDDTNTTLPPVNLLTDNSLNDISLTEQEIIDTIQILNVNKAVGEDLISHKVLKNICHSISKPLCILYNKSLHTSTFPNIWKSAIVMPLFKKGDQNLVTNYRPISLLSCLGKLMERVVYKHLYNHLMAENLIYSKQSGFLSGHSTVYQLIDIFHQITQALDEKLYTCMVFCDISKAFDRVWHKGLVFKLKQNGINGSLLSWIDSYLNGRSQKVFLGSVMSNTRNVSAGVPQGSVLGPLFFLVYVNDIVDKLLSITRLFADDTSISSTSRNKDDIEGILNHDLNLISLWSKQWLVDFNPNKTEALFFTPHRFENNPNLLFDGVQVNFVDNHKHLGLSFSKDGKWHHHINSVITSASRVLGMLRKIKFSVKRKTLNQIYVSFLRPLLEYASVVWDGCTLYEKENLEKIQLEAARIVTGLTRSVSLEKLYKEIGWLKLSERRKYQKLVTTYKIMSGLAPSYLNEIFPNTVNRTNPYPVRNSQNLATMCRRTELFSNSFVPSSAALWNDLPYQLKNSDTLQAFKYGLKKVMFTTAIVPSYYNAGERYFSVIHARMRNGCSNLNSDLFRNHLTPNETCDCGVEKEDAEHFFFKCNKYTNARQKLFQSTRRFHPISCSKLLLGISNISDKDNSFLFTEVQKYIKDTNRFKQ